MKARVKATGEIIEVKSDNGCVQAVASIATRLAHALVEKYKKEEMK